MPQHQLTFRAREIIARSHHRGLSSREIGRELGRSHSTIVRELRRNRDLSGDYFPAIAHQQTFERRSLVRLGSCKIVENGDLRQYIVKHLRDEGWSPDVLAGRLRREYPHDPSMRICTATVYSFIRCDQTAGGDLHRYLSYGRKGYLKRTGPETPLPVGVLQPDGSWVMQTLAPSLSSVIVRSPQPPVSVVIDPERTLPLLSSAERDPEAASLVAGVLEQDGRWSEARALLETLLMHGLQPDGAVYHALARAKLSTGDYSGASELLHTATTIKHGEPWDGRNLLLLGESLDLLGKRAEALEAYRKAAAHNSVNEAAMARIKTPFTQAGKG